MTHAVYLAVAAPTGRKAWAIWNRKRGAVLQLCRRLGLGLMTVDAGDPGAPQRRCANGSGATRARTPPFSTVSR